MKKSIKGSTVLVLNEHTRHNPKDYDDIYGKEAVNVDSMEVRNDEVQGGYEYTWRGG